MPLHCQTHRLSEYTELPTFSSSVDIFSFPIHLLHRNDGRCREEKCIVLFRRQRPGRTYCTSSPPLVTASNHSLGTAGGAIFHTGSLHLFDTSFVANQAGIEGVAVRSVGFVKELSNVYFLDNAYVCPAGEYGYIVKNEASDTHKTYVNPITTLAEIQDILRCINHCACYLTTGRECHDVCLCIGSASRNYPQVNLKIQQVAAGRVEGYNIHEDGGGSSSLAFVLLPQGNTKF